MLSLLLVVVMVMMMMMMMMRLFERNYIAYNFVECYVQRSIKVQLYKRQLPIYTERQKKLITSSGRRSLKFTLSK